jgi:lipoprotein-anchoring transpeptidase ErfK/SrfK
MRGFLMPRRRQCFCKLSLSFFAAIVGCLMNTSLQAAPEYAVEIDLQEQRAYLLRYGRMLIETPISSGRAKYRTPTGRFQIIDKDVDHRSSLYGKIIDSRGRTVVADADADMPVPPGGKFVNAPMPYFMRFTGGIGMHAGYLPGYAASHGCVRLPEDRARTFFEAVETGTPVTVFGDVAVQQFARREQDVQQPRLQRFVPTSRGWW